MKLLQVYKYNSLHSLHEVGWRKRNGGEKKCSPKLRWYWTGRPVVLRFMGLQRVGHDWATDLNWTELTESIYQGKEFSAKWGIPVYPLQCIPCLCPRLLFWVPWVDSHSFPCHLFSLWSHMALSLIKWWKGAVKRENWLFNSISYSGPNSIGVFEKKIVIKHDCAISHTSLPFVIPPILYLLTL